MDNLKDKAPSKVVDLAQELEALVRELVVLKAAQESLSSQNQFPLINRLLRLLTNLK